nr:1-aminocyclopropane-1-carboxylate oxidase like 1 [Quercus suber]
MINGIQRFHEQDTEVKKEFYSNDYGKKVLYLSNYDVYQSAAANWRDTFICFAAPNPPELEELPAVCRHIVNEYSKRAINLGLTLFELLSEALGLSSSHLKDMDCAEGLLLLGRPMQKNIWRATSQKGLTGSLRYNISGCEDVSEGLDATL